VRRKSCAQAAGSETQRSFTDTHARTNIGRIPLSCNPTAAHTLRSPRGAALPLAPLHSAACGCLFASAARASMASAAHATFAALPRAVAHTIFALLPVAARARCAAVCCSWRAALAERGAWLRLDLSPGNAPRALNDTLFAALAARAGGQLQSLNVKYCDVLSTEALLAVLTANAAALVEVRTTKELQLEAFEALARAAPRLRLFKAKVGCCNSAATAGRVLRNKAPSSAALRLRVLEANLQGGDEADVPLLAAGVAAHAPLMQLAIFDGPLGTAAALDALVDAALARRLSNLTLMACHLPPTAAASLARLLVGDALTTLYISDFHKRLIDRRDGCTCAEQRTACKQQPHFPDSVRGGLLAPPGRLRSAAGSAYGAPQHPYARSKRQQW
jgi:hypothetical protein